MSPAMGRTRRRSSSTSTAVGPGLSESDVRTAQSASSSDDVRSDCDKLLDGSFGSRVSSGGGASETTSGEAAATRTPPEGYANLDEEQFEGDPHFGNLWEERAKLPPNLQDNKDINFSKTHTIQEVQYRGQMRVLPKRSERGSSNPWRRYGALKTIYQVGGYVYSGKDRKTEKYVKPHTACPAPPRTSEMSVNRDANSKKANCLGVTLPVGVPAEELSRQLAAAVVALATEDSSDTPASRSTESESTDSSEEEEEAALRARARKKKQKKTRK